MSNNKVKSVALVFVVCSSVVASLSLGFTKSGAGMEPIQIQQLAQSQRQAQASTDCTASAPHVYLGVGGVAEFNTGKDRLGNDYGVKVKLCGDSSIIISSNFDPDYPTPTPQAPSCVGLPVVIIQDPARVRFGVNSTTLTNCRNVQHR